MPKLKRIFIPGSEWLYYKVYVGLRESDKVLCECLYPLVKRLFKDNLISGWFFIRYSDPDYHIRFRVRLKDTSAETIGRVIVLINSRISPYIKEGLVRRIVIDTYQREIERYGVKTMDTCEHFFMTDSDIVCRLISTKEDGSSQWITGLSIMSSLVNMLYPDIDKRISFLQSRSDGYCMEFGYTGKSLQRFNELYRKYRKQIEEAILSNTAIKAKEGLKLKQIISELNAHNAVQEVGASLIHMRINRFFVTNQRMYEMLLYYLLLKATRSLSARQLV